MRQAIKRRSYYSLHTRNLSRFLLVTIGSVQAELGEIGIYVAIYAGLKKLVSVRRFKERRSITSRSGRTSRSGPKTTVPV